MLRPAVYLIISELRSVVVTGIVATEEARTFDTIELDKVTLHVCLDNDILDTPLHKTVFCICKFAFITAETHIVPALYGSISAFYPVTVCSLIRRSPRGREVPAVVSTMPPSVPIMPRYSCFDAGSASGVVRPPSPGEPGSSPFDTDGRIGSVR